MEENLETKKCVKCREEKLLEDFWKRKDGSRWGVCKECTQEKKKDDFDGYFDDQPFSWIFSNFH